MVYRCPRPGRHANGDAHPSLKINFRKNVWACFPCGAGGTAWQLAAFLAGLDAGDKRGVSTWLRGQGLLRNDSKSDVSRILAEYDYRDESGKLLYQVVRYEPKGFRQRQPDGVGGWRWNLDGVRRVLYRLPELLNSAQVLVCEGEKDCETAFALELVATCNPGGAGKWREAYDDSLRGKSVAIIADADAKGRRHAEQVAASLSGKAKSVKVLELPQGKDLSEWVAAGGTRDILLELIQSTPEWRCSSKAAMRSGFSLTPLRDLLAEPEEKVSWLLADKLPTGGISILSAKPKAGKSTFARCLALAVARRRNIPWLHNGAGSSDLYRSRRKTRGSPASL